MEDKYPLVSQEDRNEFLKYDEVNTFFLIDGCGAFMWRMSHDMSHGRIPQESHQAIQEDINKIRQIQKFAADNLTRFGVDPETVSDKENGEYWKWYNHWNNWKKNLTEDEWNIVSKLIDEKKSIEVYLPEYSWNGNYDPVI